MSIHAVTGGDDVQELPLPALLAAAVILAAAAAFGCARARPHRVPPRRAGDHFRRRVAGSGRSLVL